MWCRMGRPPTQRFRVVERQMLAAVAFELAADAHGEEAE